MMKVFVRITGQLSTAINPVVGSMSRVIVPWSLLDASPSYNSCDLVLASGFGVGFGFDSGGGNPAGSVWELSSPSFESCAVSVLASLPSPPGTVPLINNSGRLLVESVDAIAPVVGSI